MKVQRVIAIDFDETITDNTAFPVMGKVRPEAIVYIKSLYEKGYNLILWTCREGKYLNEALNALKEADILKYFKYINDNGTESTARKIAADFYIDDRSCFGEINWQSIYNYIIDNIN